MAFKNIKTATAQELGRIAGVQHRTWGIRNPKQKSIFQKPLDFDAWFLKGIRFYEIKGYDFEFLAEGLIRISKEGKSMLRTLADFEREHEEYKANFYL